MNVHTLSSIPNLITPTSIAVIDEQDDVWTYARLVELVDGYASDMRSREVAPGDRVALMSTNFVDGLAIIFAAAGAVSVPLNVRAGAEETAHLLQDARQGVPLRHVPTMLTRILPSDNFGPGKLGSLESITYGQTGTTSTVAVLGPDDHRLIGGPADVESRRERLRSVGKVVDDVEVRIVDESGHALPVDDVGVVGMPDVEWGEQVVAHVVARRHLDHSDLDHWAREHLTSYKCPTRYHFVDSLP